MAQPENIEGRSIPSENQQPTVPWYRQASVRGVGGIVVVLLVFGGPRLYNQYQANQIEDKLDLIDAALVEPIPEDEIRAFASLDVSDEEVIGMLNLLATELGRGPMNPAEVMTVRAQVAEFDDLVAGGASCDKLLEWVNDRYVNASGIVDYESMSFFGAAVTVWAPAEASIRVQECEL